MSDLKKVREEVEVANLREIIDSEIVVINNRRAIVKPDGIVFFLDTLSDGAYWAFMSMREHSWYE